MISTEGESRPTLTGVTCNVRWPRYNSLLSKGNVKEGSARRMLKRYGCSGLLHYEVRDDSTLGLDGAWDLHQCQRWTKYKCEKARVERVL